jgi:hypothetical protein
MVAVAQQQAAVSRESLEDIAARHGGSLEFHRFAKLLPVLELDRLESLAEDIKANGLNRKIVLFGGQILDGRNRYVAYLMAKGVPSAEAFEEFGGDELQALGYVVSENFHRRDLSSSQRAMLAVDFANMLAELETAAAERKNQADKLKRDDEGRFRQTAPVPQRIVEVDGSSQNGDSDESHVPQRIVERATTSESGSGNGQAAPAGADFEGLGISGTIANKLRESGIRLDEVLPSEWKAGDAAPSLGDLEQLAGLTRAEVTEVERCVEDRLRGREVKPAAAVPPAAKKSSAKKDAGESAKVLADKFKTNKQYVRQAQELKKKSPAKAQEVREGRKTLPEAMREERGPLADEPKPGRYLRKLSRFVHELSEETEAAHNRAQRVIAYPTSLLNETGMQGRKELAHQALTTIIPELQMTGKILEIEVNE